MVADANGLQTQKINHQATLIPITPIGTERKNAKKLIDVIFFIDQELVSNSYHSNLENLGNPKQCSKVSSKISSLRFSDKGSKW